KTHCGFEQIILAAEIVVDDARCDAGGLADARNRGAGEAVFAHAADGGQNELTAADGLHAELGQGLLRWVAGNAGCQNNEICLNDQSKNGRLYRQSRGVDYLRDRRKRMQGRSVVPADNASEVAQT